MNTIFSGNSPRDIVMTDPGSGKSVPQKFEFSNCVFSGDFPGATFASIGNGCVSRSATLSIPIYHLETHYCPAKTPTPTSSNVFVSSHVFAIIDPLSAFSALSRVETVIIRIVVRTRVGVNDCHSRDWTWRNDAMKTERDRRLTSHRK
jgi:hypothetical protein